MRLRVALSFDVSLGLDELERYLEITEKYLQKAKTDFETWFDEKTKGLTPKERGEFGEFYTDTYGEYTETFPRILRDSFFVSAYSWLEHEMVVICRWLKKDKQLPISWGDLRGSTLDQFKLYCKLAGLDLTYDDQNWQEINNYRRIRNCVVHNRGLIKGSREEQELYAYASRKNIIQDSMIGLSIRSQAQIALTEEFCKEVTKTIWAFLNEAIEAHDSQKQK